MVLIFVLIHLLRLLWYCDSFDHYGLGRKLPSPKKRFETEEVLGRAVAFKESESKRK